MPRTNLCLTVLLFTPLTALIAADDAPVSERGTLLFEDSFQRDEPTPGKELIGNGWTSNSGWRAAGKQQVDLDRGAMHVTRLPEADHGGCYFP